MRQNIMNDEYMKYADWREWQDSLDDEDQAECSYCDGEGCGIVGVDWDCSDGINGPYDGEVETCPNCGGSGKAKDMTFW